MNCGPFRLRSRKSHSAIAPEPPDKRRPPCELGGAQVHLPAFHHQLPLQRRQLPGLGNPFVPGHARVVQRREDRRDEECEQVPAFHLVDEIQCGPGVLVGFVRASRSSG